MEQSIKVHERDRGAYAVVVSEDGTEATYVVTVDPVYAKKLGVDPDTPESVSDLVHRSFAFLLAHESKESILPEFDLELVATYFPNYETEIMKS